MIDHRYSDKEQELVFSWLREFNQNQNGIFMRSLEKGAEKTFFLVARDSDNSVLGGLQGMIIHAWVRIELMAISPENRNQGIGSQLVNAAEIHGKSQGCTYAYVDTMSFQAPKFYEKLGYLECGRLKDWDSHGHDKLFFTKSL